jgi:hypothetical protein
MGMGRLGKAEHDEVAAVALQTVQPRLAGQLLGECVGGGMLFAAPRRASAGSATWYGHCRSSRPRVIPPLGFVMRSRTVARRSACGHPSETRRPPPRSRRPPSWLRPDRSISRGLRRGRQTRRISARALAMVVGTVEAGRTHPLYRDLLADATFHQLLLACDADLAEAARAGRCALLRRRAAFRLLSAQTAGPAAVYRRLAASNRIGCQTPITRAVWQTIAASERVRGQSDQLFSSHGFVGCLNVGRETILASPGRILGHLHFLLDVIERLACLHH